VPIKTKIKSGVRRLPPPLANAAIKTARKLQSTPKDRRPPSDALRDRLDEAFASKSPKAIDAVLTELHALQAHAERLASPPATPDNVRISETSGVQSLQFMVDLLPYLQKKLATYPRGRSFDVLDIGPGTGMGTALLAQLYSPPARLGYKMNVKAVDISPLYSDYIRVISPRVPFLKDDIFTHSPRYDFVIASHVIEHVPDPVAFCHRMQELAREAVYVLCPFNEPADKLTKGHVNVIDAATVEAMKPTWHLEVNSVSWGAFMDPPYEMLIAELPGLAS
jgi:SAM-dependent methyltransferase